MICKKCGTQLPDNARFCGNCGASFDELTSSPTKPVENSAASNYNQQPIYNNVNTTPVKKSSKVLSVILGIIAIIIGIVIYAVTYSCSYNKTRDRSYSHSSSYSSSSKDSNDKNSIKQFELSVDNVKGGTLSGYENKTIEAAFNSTFSDPEWAFEENGGKQYVCFKGNFYTAEGDAVIAVVLFFYSPLVHDEYKFGIDSIAIGDGTNVANLSESEATSFLNWIYYDEDFQWTWDNESDIKLS